MSMIVDKKNCSKDSHLQENFCFLSFKMQLHVLCKHLQLYLLRNQIETNADRSCLSIFINPRTISAVTVESRYLEFCETRSI